VEIHRSIVDLPVLRITHWDVTSLGVALVELEDGGLLRYSPGGQVMTHHFYYYYYYYYYYWVVKSLH